jgi:hypothetical protein
MPFYKLSGKDFIENPTEQFISLGSRGEWKTIIAETFNYGKFADLLFDEISPIPRFCSKSSSITVARLVITSKRTQTWTQFESQDQLRGVRCSRSYHSEFVSDFPRGSSNGRSCAQRKALSAGTSICLGSVRSKTIFLSCILQIFCPNSGSTSCLPNLNKKSALWS